MRQHTLRGPLDFAGVGLHTGAGAHVRLLPQTTGGLQFVLADGTLVPATAEYVVETRRATVVGRDGKTISTVEHLLSALFAMGVDHAEIHVEGPEIPVLDGSAATFAEAIAKTGLAELPADRARFVVDAPLVREDGDAVVCVVPCEEFRVSFGVDYAPPVGAQYLDVAVTPELFVRDVAPARTFGYLHEVEALRSAGLARGGTLENALVFAPDGPLTPLRWPNEVVRHKVLDLIGDFALLGAWPAARVIALKSGHKLHQVVTAALRERAALASPGGGGTTLRVVK